MTDEERAEIERDVAALEAAKLATTPGAWEYRAGHVVCNDGAIDHEALLDDDGTDEDGEFLDPITIAGVDDDECSNADSDGAFIALAHETPIETHCRSLLSEVDRMRAEVDTLRARLARLASAATAVVDHGRDGAAVQHDAAVRGLREAVADVLTGDGSIRSGIRSGP
jgi:hypothetical protein